jgi:tetratricopeptide (TPR) repeat protein
MEELPGPADISIMPSLRNRADASDRKGGRRSSPWWVSYLAGTVMLFSWSLLLQRGEAWGLPATSLRDWLLLYWVCGSLVEMTVHELGHGLAAWAVGFRVRTISIGPLTICNDLERGRYLSWQWKRLLLHGGYAGCIPTAEAGVRGNMIFVVLCGPLISIMAGLGLLSLVLAAPGSAWQNYWEVLLALALLFVVDSLANLVPAGDLDGALLLHLILWTERGTSYVASLRSGKFQEDASESRSSGDLEGKVERLEQPDQRQVAHWIRGAVARRHFDHGEFETGLYELNRALAECPSDPAHDHDRAALSRSRAECLFLMGLPERGLEDVAQAAAILRAALARDQEAGRVLGELAALGAVAWKSRRAEPAVGLVREALEGFERRGLAARATEQRLALSAILCNAGRLREAEAALPREEDVLLENQEPLFRARGEIALLAGRGAQAIQNFEEALRLAKQAALPRPAHIAEVECALAEAYLEANRDDEAGALATTAGAVLRDLQHPEECRSLLILARLVWKHGADGGSMWCRALEIIRNAPLIQPATRARWLEQVAAKLIQDGRPAEAAEARSAAESDWRGLGFTPENAREDAVLVAR